MSIMKHDWKMHVNWSETVHTMRKIQWILVFYLKI
jgi:hypothetical protein